MLNVKTGQEESFLWPILDLSNSNDLVLHVDLLYSPVVEDVNHS